MNSESSSRQMREQTIIENRIICVIAGIWEYNCQLLEPEFPREEWISKRAKVRSQKNVPKYDKRLHQPKQPASQPTMQVKKYIKSSETPRKPHPLIARRIRILLLPFKSTR